MSATANIATAAVEIANLRFHYPSGGFSLTIPELQLDAASATAVIGPSGSGKTTLLHLIAGILTPNEGTVRVGDTDVSALSDRDRRRFRISRIGQVFQDFALLDYLSVRENILLPYFIHSALRLDNTVRTRLSELAESLGIAPLLSRRITRLSQGERQRAALCRALLPGPDLILADEPTGNLDPAFKQKMVAMLIEQARLHGSTLIMVTHDHTLLDRFGRVVDFADFVRTA